MLRLPYMRSARLWCFEMSKWSTTRELCWKDLHFAIMSGVGWQDPSHKCEQRWKLAVWIMLIGLLSKAKMNTNTKIDKRKCDITSNVIEIFEVMYTWYLFRNGYQQELWYIHTILKPLIIIDINYIWLFSQFSKFGLPMKSRHQWLISYSNAYEDCGMICCWFWTSRPATAAELRVEMTPEKRAERATFETSPAREGAIWDSTPICVPSEPKLPNP